MQQYLQALHRPQVSSDVQSHMEKIQICDKVYQRGDACPAAEECLRLMWRLTVSVIQSWVHKPRSLRQSLTAWPGAMLRSLVGP